MYLTFIIKIIILSGIYIHIPFCKKACHYCNFHFSTRLNRKEQMIEALVAEINQRHTYLDELVVDSIYFGGGTPSLLTSEEINVLLSHLQNYFDLAADAEITLEANPDDLSVDYLQALRSTAINRLSIGVQSFDEEDLQFMNRAHSAKEALDCIQNAQKEGFQNLTIDLIYGAPTTSHQKWKTNLQQAFDLGVRHLSCYALTVEPKTALEYKIKKGLVPAVEDEHSAQQFEILLQMMQANGYEQYEISNFCKPSFYAKHNRSYWQGIAYLGLGPSAHSFDGVSRQWNRANNEQYMQQVKAAELYWEKEILSLADQYNEYIMTALRTKWGVQKSVLHQRFAAQTKAFEMLAQAYIQEGWMHLSNHSYTLTASGKLLADSIISDFFID